jgi:hypothetical protein
MTIKVDFTIDDATLEAGIAQGLYAHNAATGESVSAADFVAAGALAAMEAWRGSDSRAVLAQAASLPPDKLAEVAAAARPTLDAKLAEVVAEKAALAEVAVSVEAIKP